MDSSELYYFMYYTFEAGNQQFLQNDLSGQRRLRPACVSAQSDQSLHCPNEKALAIYRAQMQARSAASDLGLHCLPISQH